jgi:RNA polymerase sigma factor (sigma-70 family)
MTIERECRREMPGYDGPRSDGGGSADGRRLGRSCTDDPRPLDVRIPPANRSHAREETPTAIATIDIERDPRPVTVAEPGRAADDELMRRVRSGDERAFRELFARYAPVAHGLAHRLVRQAQLAEEIVQEAFLSVWRTPERYDGSRGSVRSWLLGAVHNRAVDAVRREESQRRRADQAAGALDVVATDPADDLVLAIDRPREQRLVREALADLPAEQRDVISKMYFDGLSQTQIAERTGVPLGTVKSRTLLGMRRLRSSLGDLER